MLRIKGADAPPPDAPLDVLTDAAPPAPPDLPPQEDATSGPADPDAPSDSPGTVDQAIVVYMGGEYGPFKCSACTHFLAPNACAIVAGQIEPDGLCRIFTPGDKAPEEQDSKGPEDMMAAMPEATDVGPAAPEGPPPPGPPA